MDQAGEQGELLALEAVQRAWARRGPLGVYPALRVPKSTQAGKNEIDLVVLTETHVLAIEVKHWAGRIQRESSGRWLQIGAEQKNHPDHLALIAAKAQDLCRYVQQQGVDLPSEHCLPWLLFTHPGASLGAELLELPGVLTLAQLEPRLRPLLSCAGPGWLRRAVGGLLGRGRSTPGAYQQRQAALDRLPTWDQLELRGGRRLKGDLRSLSLELAAGRPLQRAGFRELEVRAPESLLPMLLRGVQLRWRGPGEARGGKGRAKPGQSLRLMLAGQGRELVLPLEAVEKLRLGWQDESYYDPSPVAEQAQGRGPGAADPPHYRPGQRFEGQVVSVVEFGLFVRFDGPRQGLVPRRRLEAGGRGVTRYQPGQALDVSFVSARRRADGKLEVELDLA
jgi:hypothetical protein